MPAPAPVKKSLVIPRRVRRRGRGAAAGMTLIEILITMAVMALLGGASILGMGVIESARLKRSAIMVTSAVRVAYAHANATSRPVRLVFDFEERTITLEESSSKLAIAKGDRTGGAEAATDAEREAQEEAERKDPKPLELRAPRPQFQPAKAYGFDTEDGKKGKQLETSVRFLQIETDHQEEPETERAYLYFWPGGQTERASIQLVRGRPGQEPTDDEIMTILVSPLTGKVELRKGRANLPKMRDEEDESEREDSGF